MCSFISFQANKYIEILGCVEGMGKRGEQLIMYKKISYKLSLFSNN